MGQGMKNPDNLPGAVRNARNSGNVPVTGNLPCGYGFYGFYDTSGLFRHGMLPALGHINGRYWLATKMQHSCGNSSLPGLEKNRPEKEPFPGRQPPCLRHV
jgi:hypothetical protein